MNKKNLAIALATVVFMAGCDVGNNSHIKLNNHGNTDIITKRRTGTKNYSKTYLPKDSEIDTSDAADACKEFMQDEMNIPSNGRWSSVEDLTKTIEGWEWRGWVDVDGYRNNFVCNINHNEVTAFIQNKSYPDTFYDSKINTSDAATSCQEFMQYEMGIPSSSQWSSEESITKTIEGWEWRGWVDVDGDRNKFLCTINNNGVSVVTNFEDSYHYEYEYTY